MEISIVLPVYNEEENIKYAVEKCNSALKKGFNEYEIIIVNDGSTDNSSVEIDKISMEFSFVKSIHFKKKSRTECCNISRNNSFPLMN